MSKSIERAQLIADNSWRKSRQSGYGNCVEVGAGGGWVGIRDTKDRAQTPVIVAAGVWVSFLEGVKRGELS
ncbi:DUF397 domain-containing protein [Cryptosporangium phraense]|uniref:DUF397 domain-containing protein n=1 Tax=Cryptosporangium phraense TaxID=2593070 RepID=A0A545ALW7_9ACTN|nr:DUF397 domain-containing protein [Cryptosporangium phraense]TQS42281.1 DUF397 domain-containing protein [Cryptosporangium phraense]